MREGSADATLDVGAEVVDREAGSEVVARADTDAMRNLLRWNDAGTLELSRGGGGAGIKASVESMLISSSAFGEGGRPGVVGAYPS